MKVDNNSHRAVESLPNNVQSYGQYVVLYNKIIFLQLIFNIVTIKSVEIENRHRTHYGHHDGTHTSSFINIIVQKIFSRTKRNNRIVHII